MYHSSPEPHWLLLVKPEVSVSTAAAYGQYKGQSKASSDTITTVLSHLKNNDLYAAFMSSANTFEELLFPDHEELISCKEFFTSRGYPTIMTGSGPTMVVLLDKATQALALQEEIKKRSAIIGFHSSPKHAHRRMFNDKTITTYTLRCI